jgi:glutamine synthetase
MNVEESDLFLFPDLRRCRFSRGVPRTGGCAVLLLDQASDGTAFEGDGRSNPDEGGRKPRDGLYLQDRSECEFYLIAVDDKGTPTKIPHDRGGYFDIAPMDKGENVRREICMTLEEMGIRPESSHHEQGPGQNEIDFRYGDALQAADNLVTFKSVVKTIAARNGLYASLCRSRSSARAETAFTLTSPFLKTDAIFSKASGTSRRPTPRALSRAYWTGPVKCRFF